ncbi:hypothetical protein BGZ46_008995 [Entomortierella lignicola]|nr:hypothetical protein BGZ46_008995 [Entomortierella lignicola]
MNSTEEPIHVIVRLPYARPDGYVDTQPVQWTEAMEKTLWQIIGQTKPSLVDWNAISRQLGNVPVPFLIRHAAFLYQNQLQDLHRFTEQQDMTTARQASSRGVIGPGTVTTSFEGSPIAQNPSPLSQGIQITRESPGLEPSKTGPLQFGEKDSRGSIKKEAAVASTNSSNPNIQPLESGVKTQASPSLSGSISTFPTYARPASLSSSASTIRPVQPSSPSPSLRSVATTETNLYNSGVLSNRGQPQPRSTRGSQLINAAPSSERRLNNQIVTLPTSPREETSFIEGSRRITEPAHPFHQATISASTRFNNTTNEERGHGARNSPGRLSDQGQANVGVFHDSERSSTVSTVSTPYSQSNSTSQIFEETSFFNQLSSNDSITRGQLRAEDLDHDGLSGRGAFQQQFSQSQRVYGLGFMEPAPYYSRNDHHVNVDDDDDSEDHTDRDTESVDHDESGPLSEQIKQLQLEDVLAFLPSGGMSASSILPKPGDNETYQRRTTSGDNMPFQLDDELASLGTRTLGEILDHDEEDSHRVRNIRFKDSVGPNRIRGIGRDGERSVPSSRKSSAQNSVGSSFSDLSDSSVTRSAMEDAYLSGYNNNTRIHPDSLTSHVQDGPSSRKRKSSYEDISPLVMKTRAGVGLEQEILEYCEGNYVTNIMIMYFDDDYDDARPEKIIGGTKTTVTTRAIVPNPGSANSIASTTLSVITDPSASPQPESMDILRLCGRNKRLRNQQSSWNEGPIPGSDQTLYFLSEATMSILYSQLRIVSGIVMSSLLYSEL